MSMPSEDVIQLVGDLFSTYWVGAWRVLKSGLELMVLDTTRNEDDTSVGSVPSSIAILVIPEMTRPMNTNEVPIRQPKNMHATLGYLTPRIPEALLGDALCLQMNHALASVEGDTLELNIGGIYPSMLLVDNDCEGDTLAWLVHFLRLSMLQYVEHRRPFDYGSRLLDWPYNTQTDTSEVYFPGLHITVRGVGPAMERVWGPERTELIRRASLVADRRGDGLFAGSSLAPVEVRTHVDLPRSSGEAVTLPTQLQGPEAVLRHHPSENMVRVAFNVTTEDWAFLTSSGAIDPWQQVLRLSHFCTMGLGDLGRETPFTTADYEIPYTSEAPNAGRGS